MKKSTATTKAASTSLKLQKESVKALAVKTGIQAGAKCAYCSTIIKPGAP